MGQQEAVIDAQEIAQHAHTSARSSTYADGISRRLCASKTREKSLNCAFIGGLYLKAISKEASALKSLLGLYLKRPLLRTLLVLANRNLLIVIREGRWYYSLYY